MVAANIMISGKFFLLSTNSLITPELTIPSPWTVSAGSERLFSRSRNLLPRALGAEELNCEGGAFFLWRVAFSKSQTWPWLFLPRVKEVQRPVLQIGMLASIKQIKVGSHSS
jgi:hypothetical protein